jgi:DNA-binding response OmpR family regulator
MPAPWTICLVDDTAHWHEVSERSIALFEDFVYEGFDKGHAFLAAMRERSHDAWPDAVLMDFYIGDSRGNDITRAFRAMGGPQIPVIGYSTMASGSEAIVTAGGTAIVRKHNDARGRNPSLITWIGDWWKLLNPSDDG